MRQCRAPDPAGPAVSDANETRGRGGAAEGETATGATKGGDEASVSRGDGSKDNDEACSSRGEREDGGDQGGDKASANRGDGDKARASRGEGKAPEDGKGGSVDLDGGVANDSAWQAWWRDLSVMP